MSKIDHIDFDGERYPFVDQSARDDNLRLKAKLDSLSKDLATETQRAKDAEEALNSVMLKKEPGKGLSTNDFTDDYKERVDNLKPMIGASEDEDGVEGYAPAPKKGEQNKFLKGDGRWSYVPLPDNATHTKSGLMSTADKIKLDNIDQESDDVVACTTTRTANGMVQTFATGKVATVTFNSDGSIDKTITQDGRSTIHLHTEFGVDGSIVRTRR